MTTNTGTRRGGKCWRIGKFGNINQKNPIPYSNRAMRNSSNSELDWLNTIVVHYSDNFIGNLCLNLRQSISQYRTLLSVRPFSSPNHPCNSGQANREGPSSRRSIWKIGGGGIRTLGDVTATPVFKTGAFGRSATPPNALRQQWFFTRITLSF